MRQQELLVLPRIHAFLTFATTNGIPSFRTMTLDLHSIVVASKDQLASSIGGETVILGLSAGRYYGVDSVGACGASSAVIRSNSEDAFLVTL